MKRFLLMIVAIVGIPLVWVLSRCALQTLVLDVLTAAFFSFNRVMFASGCVAMTLLYLWKGRALSVTYVFAHEMTHAFAGVCCLAKIHTLNISRQGGFVTLSKHNLFITLAPYCLPFYLLCALLLYLLLQCLIPDAIPFAVWAFIFGFLTAFHVLYTASALLTVAQPDLLEYGRLFSWWLIIVANLAFALAALTLTSPKMTLFAQTHHVISATLHVYSDVGRGAKGLISRVIAPLTSSSKEARHESRR